VTAYVNVENALTGIIRKLWVIGFAGEFSGWVEVPGGRE